MEDILKKIQRQQVILKQIENIDKDLSRLKDLAGFLLSQESRCYLTFEVDNFSKRGEQQKSYDQMEAERYDPFQYMKMMRERAQNDLEEIERRRKEGEQYPAPDGYIFNGVHGIGVYSKPPFSGVPTPEDLGMIKKKDAVRMEMTNIIFLRMVDRTIDDLKRERKELYNLIEKLDEPD